MASYLQLSKIENIQKCPVRLLKSLFLLLENVVQRIQKAFCLTSA